MHLAVVAPSRSDSTTHYRASSPSYALSPVDHLDHTSVNTVRSLGHTANEIRIIIISAIDVRTEKWQWQSGSQSSSSSSYSTSIRYQSTSLLVHIECSI